MKNKYVFVGILLAIILVAGTGLTLLYMHTQTEDTQSEDLQVVTSFYPMYIAAENVIGDCPGVDLKNLSEPQTGCLHDYQPTSEDMRLLSEADVFIVNGGGIETFLTDIAQEYPDLVIIDACENLQDEKLEEDNAHAWMSMTAYENQLDTICQGMCTVDGAHQQTYQENTAAYVNQIHQLKEAYAFVFDGFQHESVVIFHEAYEYLTEELGMDVAGVLDLDEQRQVSAGEVSDILDVIEKEDVSLIIAEELYGKDMGDMISKETGVPVLYLDTLVRGEYGADQYLEGMRANLELLKEYLEIPTTCLDEL